jgi:hypothetical protein
MQECGPPVASDNDPPPRSRWFTAEEAKNRQQFGCPICLPSSARIETPRGSVAIGEIVPGMTVVSVDETGARIAARVTYVGSAEVAASHELVVLELEDGRVVRASEGHPLAGGRTFAKIVAGDAIDGARVRSVTRVPYSGGRTWDLIVDSPTGFYVADGVVLASTLRAHASAVGTR